MENNPAICVENLSKTISIFLKNVIIQGGSNMTGTNCDLFTHK
jgi:hypothetical protein